MDNNLVNETMDVLDSICKESEEWLCKESNPKSIASLATSLRNVVRNNERKHTPYIIVRKEVVLPIIDEIYELANSKADFSECSKCALYKGAMNQRVACETIERLLRMSNSNNSPVTKDEAKNLAEVFGMNIRE